MIGMSNAIFDGDSSINGNRDRIEQKENNDWYYLSLGVSPKWINEKKAASITFVAFIGRMQQPKVDSSRDGH